MAKLVLHHANPSRSSTIRWMLEEIGAPYEVHRLNLREGDGQKPDFLALNPMGKVPVLEHGGAVISEVSAIATYLADAFPQAKLAPPIGDPRRGPYLKWMFFAPSCLELCILERAFPRKELPPRSSAGFGTVDLTLDVTDAAIAEGKPWLLGDQFTAADIVIGATVRWGTMFKLMPDRPHFADYVKRIEARPAFQRALALDAQEASPQ